MLIVPSPPIAESLLAVPHSGPMVEPLPNRRAGSPVKPIQNSGCSYYELAGFRDGPSTRFTLLSRLNRMVRLYSPFLALCLCFPALAQAQQTSAPAPADKQTAPQAPALAPRPAFTPTPAAGEGHLHLDV